MKLWAAACGSAIAGSGALWGGPVGAGAGAPICSTQTAGAVEHTRLDNDPAGVLKWSVLGFNLQSCGEKNRSTYAFKRCDVSSQGHLSKIRSS